MTSLSIKESLVAGWNLTKSRYLLILAFLGTFAGIGLVRFFLNRGIDSNAVKIVLGLGFQLLNWFLAFNALSLSIKLSDGKDVSYADLWTPQGRYWMYVLATILYGMLTGAGILLLIVPGVIWGLMFMFYGYIIVEKGQGPIEALKSSKALTYGHKKTLFLFSLASIGINLGGALMLGLGLFVTMPMTYFAIVYMYRQLSPVATEVI